MNPPEDASGVRRLAAFLVDYGVIAAYIALLAGISFVASTWRGAAIEMLGPTTFDRLGAEALGFLMLTLPVVFYFALMESSTRGASLGKRALRAPRGGHRRSADLGCPELPPLNAQVHSSELAHSAIWQIPGRPFVNPPGAASWAALVAANGLALLYLGSLFIGRRATRTIVRPAPGVVRTPGTSTPSIDRVE